MCWVFQDSGELPSQTASLYRRGIRLLLEKWNDRKDISEWEVGEKFYRQLSIDQKEALLTEIAARKFENPGNFVLFEQQDLAQQIANFLKLADAQEGEAVLKAIEAQHGLLVERADELWSFSHLTFQEYFTAQWLNQLQQNEGLAEKIADKRWHEIVNLAVRSQQPADRLLRLIKQAIDYSVSQDVKLQEYLTWVQEKSEAVNAPYKAAAIRAFYFVLDLDLNRNLDIARNLDRNLDIARARTLALDIDLNRNLACAHSFTFDRNFTHILDLDIDIARNITLDINHNLDLDLDRNPDLDPTLVNQFQQLRTQLSENFFEQNWEEFERWWETNGQAWTEKLRQVMIEHRNIGHEWQFTTAQKKTLRQYYDANKFLVELLKQKGAVSESVRQEIEDNLLLPIAELKRRSPDQYS